MAGQTAAKLHPPTHMDDDLKLPPPRLSHLKGRHRDGAVGLLEGLMQLEGDLGGRRWRHVGRGQAGQGHHRMEQVSLDQTPQPYASMGKPRLHVSPGLCVQWQGYMCARDVTAARHRIAGRTMRDACC